MLKNIATLLLLSSLTLANAVTITANSTNILTQYSTDAGCKKILQELRIDNTCSEVRQIVNAFDRDPVMVATLLHESNLNRNARNVNKNGSIDYGPLQLNSGYWVIDGGIDLTIKQGIECYKDRGYGCWASYTNGKYLTRMADAKLLLKNI